jgi:transcriptional regulator with XRE-family HTH domain
MKRPLQLDIGPRVRERRKQAGLSLDALARLSGVSKAMLSQVEQNKANPTVAVMCRIAEGLRIGLGDLMGLAGPRRRFDVIRADDPKQLFLAGRKVTIRTLSPLSTEKDLEFYEVLLSPGGQLDSAPHFQHTEEYLTVARGRVNVLSGGEQILLRRGDSACYSADVPHRIANAGGAVAEVVLVVRYQTDDRRAGR